jgi:hypothetical protein
VNTLYARTVFFTDDAERSLRCYTEQLGFSMNWNYVEEGRTTVFQVKLFGFELIINETWEPTRGRAGHGRVFIGLDDDQREPREASGMAESNGCRHLRHRLDNSSVLLLASRSGDRADRPLDREDWGEPAGWPEREPIAMLPQSGSIVHGRAADTRWATRTPTPEPPPRT